MMEAILITIGVIVGISVVGLCTFFLCTRTVPCCKKQIARHTSTRYGDGRQRRGSADDVAVITDDRGNTVIINGINDGMPSQLHWKPPDYDKIADLPSYEEAIQAWTPDQQLDMYKLGGNSGGGGGSGNSSRNHRGGSGSTDGNGNRTENTSRDERMGGSETVGRNGTADRYRCTDEGRNMSTGSSEGGSGYRDSEIGGRSNSGKNDRTCSSNSGNIMDVGRGGSRRTNDSEVGVSGNTIEGLDYNRVRNQDADGKDLESGDTIEGKDSHRVTERCSKPANGGSHRLRTENELESSTRYGPGGVRNGQQTENIKYNKIGSNAATLGGSRGGVDNAAFDGNHKPANQSRMLTYNTNSELTSSSTRYICDEVTSSRSKREANSRHSNYTDPRR